MANYSPGLMRRIGIGALWGPWGSEHDLYDLFAGSVNSKVGHDIPQAYLDTSSNSSFAGARTLIRRLTPHVQRGFVPGDEPGYEALSEECYEVHDGRLYLRFIGWWTVAEMDEFWTTASDCALYIAMYNASAQTYYAQVKVKVAVRRASDSDVTESWKGAPVPDIRVVYDHTRQPDSPVLGEVLIDVTDYLCDCPRYRETGDEWRARVVNGG